MKKSFVLTAVALAGSLAIGSTALAQQYDQKQTQQRGTQQQYGEQQRQQQQPGMSQQERQQQKQQGQMAQQRQQKDMQQLSAVEDLKDMKIQNTRGEDLGSVDKVVVDTQQGRIAYLVVSTGGAWGIGGEKALVPFNAFRVQQGKDSDQQVLVLNIPQEQLKNAPQGDFDKTALTRDQAREIHRFYGVSPYWEESGKSMQKAQPKSKQDQQMKQTPQQKQ